MSDKTVPTLYDWMGGERVLRKLIAHFYEHVQNDPILQPVFTGMSPAHAEHVAAFVAGVFGGPTAYSTSHSGHPQMIRRHLNRALTEPQRQRWMTLLLTSADAVGVPADPEFRAALVAYIEWGSRLAVINSQPGVDVVLEQPMPQWGWGVPGGPNQQ